MITAKQANAIIEQTIAREITEKRERAFKFCEELSATIERRASEKFTNAVVKVDTDISSYVVTELTDNGYKTNVDKTNGALTIMW